MAGYREHDPVGFHIAAGRLDAVRYSRADAYSGDFTIFNDVDTEGARRARITPSHGVMPHRAAPRLCQCPHDLEATRRGARKFGRKPHHPVPIEKLGVYSREPHGISAAR